MPCPSASLTTPLNRFTVEISTYLPIIARDCGVVVMPPKSRPERVKFEFIRSPLFRVVHSNGVWGGLTPRGELSMAFFSERKSPPKSVTHEITPEGGLGPEVSRDVSRLGQSPNVQREWEVEVLMSLDEAENLHRWIGTRIDEWRKIGRSIPQDNPPEAT